MAEVQQAGLFAQQPARRKGRSKAQVAAYEKWAPMTALATVRALVEPELAGVMFIHPRPLWVLQYRQTIIAQDGERFILGVIVDQGAGTGIALGGVWCCRERRLRRIGRCSVGYNGVGYNGVGYNEAANDA